MIKLIVSDLDGTLARTGYSAITDTALKTLKEIESKGVKIAVCSGKPTYYLCGYLRQCDWKTPIMMGENGSVIQFGITVPPEFYRVVPYSDNAKKSLAFLKEEIIKKIPDMWFQPNNTALTPFIKEDKEFEIIDKILADNHDKLNDITAYKHSDSYDIVPNGINKGAAVKWLCEKLGIEKDEVVTMGDGVNDYSMFNESGFSLGINLADKSKATHNFSCLDDALEFIKNELM